MRPDRGGAGMRAYDVLIKKRDGVELDKSEIGLLVESYLDGELTDYQMSAFLMASFLNGLSLDETAALTEAMLSSGDVLSFEESLAPLVDKHSTGGVGDKVSLVLLPIAVECGLRVPMISGRSLGFTGGTLDKLESIPGIETSLDPEKMKEIVSEQGGCFAAQTERLVPADGKLYALRDATGTVESIPLITSSILSKKMAEGVEANVIDVKFGRGAFMEDEARAASLAEMLEEVGRRLSFKVKTILSPMDQPLGKSVGNALEVAEAVESLMGEGSDDLMALTHRLVAEMLLLAGRVETLERGVSLSKEAIDSQRALERFVSIVEAQGGRIDLEKEGFGLPRADFIASFKAGKSGLIKGIDARGIGELLREMGGGRFRAGDQIDPAPGFVFERKVGERVAVNDVICEVHASDESALSGAVSRLRDLIEIEAL